MMNISEMAVRYENFKKTRQKHSDIQISDNNEIVLDGCRRVIEYDENLIKLELSAVGISIIGMNLTMKNFSIGGVIIRGDIHSITFISKEEL